MRTFYERAERKKIAASAAKLSDRVVLTLENTARNHYLERPAACPDCVEGLREDHEIRGQRPGAHIFDVERNPPLIRETAAPAHLPESSDSGQNCSVKCTARAVPFKFLFDDGPRADETHIAEEHVEKLRQFIKIRPAQKRSDFCDSRVVFQFSIAKPLTPRIRILRKMSPEDLVAVVEHSPEFPKSERPSFETDAIVPIENWSGRAGLNNNGDKDNRDQHKRQQCNRYEKIEEPLANPVGYSIDWQEQRIHFGFPHFAGWVSGGAPLISGRAPVAIELLSH